MSIFTTEIFDGIAVITIDAPGAAVNTLSKATRLHLEQRAWNLRLLFWSESEIAEELSIDQSTVSRMLQRVGSRLASSFETQAATMRTEQTEQLRAFARAAYKRWSADGEPAHAKAMLEAMAAIRSLHGLDATKRTDITSAGQAVKWYQSFDPEEI